MRTVGKLMENRLKVKSKTIAVIWDLSDMAAWLAENGPVSVALNAFAMQVSSITAVQSTSTETAKHLSRLSFPLVLQERCFSPLEDLLQPLDD